MSVLPFAILLALAEPPAADQDVRVPAPARPLFIEPVVLGRVDVVVDAPQYAASTRVDRIGRIWAPVAINGHGPFRLVLATGASHSALTPSLVARLGIRANSTDTVILHGSTGSLAVPMVPIQTLEVGELLMESRRLAVIPDALDDADGVLGVDELSGMRIHIDFRRDRIKIARSKNQRASGSFKTIPVSFMAGQLLVVDGSMGGVPVKAIIDTGSQTTLGNAALRTALAERRRKDMLEGKLDKVIGSTLDMQVGTRLETPALELGPIRVRQSATTFADFEIFKHWKMTEEPAMLVGMDVIGLLDQLIIDYRRKELQVRLPRS